MYQLLKKKKLKISMNFDKNRTVRRTILMNIFQTDRMDNKNNIIDEFLLRLKVDEPIHHSVTHTHSSTHEKRPFIKVSR